MYLRFASNGMGISGTYIVQDIVSGNPKKEKFCYHTNCGLSCASVTVHARITQSRIYMLLGIFY